MIGLYGTLTIVLGIKVRTSQSINTRFLKGSSGNTLSHITVKAKNSPLSFIDFIISISLRTISGPSSSMIC